MTQGVSTVKHVVAIASGKGVGKSTYGESCGCCSTAGFKGWPADADIYGPSQARLLA